MNNYLRQIKGRQRGPTLKIITIPFAVTFTKAIAEAAYAYNQLFKPTDLRNVITELSNLHPGDGRITKCMQLGLRNKLCVYDGPAGLYYDVFPQEQSTNGMGNVQPSKGYPVPFVDLTRLGELGNLQGVARSRPDDSSFSEDYLDVNDLSATRNVIGNQVSPTKKQRREFNIVVVNPDHKVRYSRKLFNITDPDTELLSILRAQVKRYHSKEDSSSEDSDEDGSKPKRFEVIEKTDSEEPYRPVKVKAEGGKYIYAQAPTRHLTLDRRRLPHFLPKRYHWSLDDIKHLPYLWFNGPQGQYAGIYRKPF